MRYRLGLASLLVVVAGCGGTSTPSPSAPSPTPAPVAATPAATTPEVQYLALVEGIPGMDTSQGDPALVTAGYDACSLASEYSDEAVAAAIMRRNSLDSRTATVIVHAATTYLCPALGR
jgi:hypothetical protein